ncbi:hypothetical protein ACQWPW_001269 [Cronobacter sakazakii]|uniref:hypothetical protein n=1 Tax=Cronobacter sakazakii TaxID=28141 RepID=UPI000A19782B|nr:hypothetical protein [Cronobacter sakazakii]ELY2814935.1 hypothetical protein [Cronobacter sakazakii]ELY4507408.1 hypothetical protein [Cronobacter sakazakii]PQY53924.1 hypothetical protein C5945_01515 [Cronobacter sakazakii]PUV60353.1 hypothetical protein CDT92_21545 [Cronobacter sakazakii]PUZ03105.1 hypothetical protein B8W55_01515 [Cronobacter sakazakii]
MSDEYKKKIGIPDDHTLELVSSNFKGARKGQDTDEYLYRELDADGNVVATYEIEDSTSTHPPFGRTISYTKV